MRSRTHAVPANRSRASNARCAWAVVMRCVHERSGRMSARLASRLALVLALACVACGEEQQAAAPASEAASPRYCRRLGRHLVGARLVAAEARAAQRGCTLRVAVRDGRALALTEDFQPGRINVRVRSGAVAGVEFMG